MPTYSSALRNSLDSYLLKLKDILDTCATLRTDFEDSLTRIFIIGRCTVQIHWYFLILSAIFREM